MSNGDVEQRVREEELNQRHRYYLGSEESRRELDTIAITLLLGISVTPTIVSYAMHLYDYFSK